MKFSTTLGVIIATRLAVSAFVPQPINHGRHSAAIAGAKADREAVEKDMKEAGKAEHETEDWVAEDMDRLGSQGGDNLIDKLGWVAKDMFKTGQARTHLPQKGENVEQEKKNWDIAKDMKRTGKASDWIAMDMEEAGHAEGHNKFATDHWLNKLEHELDKGKEERKNVKKDMEETGRMGSDTAMLVRHDMEQTGHATNPYEVLQDFFNGITYKLNEWTEKAFDQDKIAKDMEQAGRSTADQTWLKDELEIAGRQGTEHAHKLPTQNKELLEDLTEKDHMDYVAKDMLREGRADTYHARTDHRRQKLVYEDMKLAGGGAAASEERVRQDMEFAGHAENSYYNPRNTETKQYKQEVEAFKSMPHAKSSVPGKLTSTTTTKGPGYEPWNRKSKEKVVEQKDVTIEETQETDKPPSQSFVRHLFKKVAHPRTPWKDL